MQSRQSQYKQMQIKFEEGMQVLEGILDDEDHIALNAALIKIHGALEDFIRLEVAERAPHLRPAVQDPRQTNWKSLLDYGTTYLAFTKSDRDTINDANQHRQKVAHGGNYEKKIADLKRYARFVQKWLQRATVSPGEDEWGKQQVIKYQRPDVPKYEPEARPAYQPPPTPVYEPERPGVADRPTPWYRSTLFLFIIFFLFPPLWAMLILTDRRHGCLPRAVAAFIVSAILVTCMALVFPSSRYSVAIERILGLIDPTPQPTLVPIQDFAPPTLDASPPSLQPATPTSESPSACNLMWVEYTASDLGGMNRSMVWEQVVSGQVEGSGMTASEFNRFVLEQNPHLVTDGYEFKSGKTYLLPECQ